MSTTSALVGEDLLRPQGELGRLLGRQRQGLVVPVRMEALRPWRRASRGRLSFFFGVHNDLFEEVAKFRAARRIWAGSCATVRRRRPDAARLRFHTQTDGAPSRPSSRSAGTS